MSLTRERSIEIGHSELTVAIEFIGDPGVKQTWDHPGWPAEVELWSVSAVEWNGRERDDHWIWGVLDSISWDSVLADWSLTHEDFCLEHYNEHLWELKHGVA